MDAQDSSSAQGSGTARALLEASRRLFAAHGFDGASIREITRTAGANLGAVTYHFGSKAALYTAVLRAVIGPLRDRVRAAAEADAPPLQRVEAVMRAFFGYYAEHPDLPRLMMQQIASGRPPPRPVAAMIRKTLETLTAVIREGQADGSIRDGDPVRMALSVVAQPVYLTLVRPLVREVLSPDPSVASLPELVDHAAVFVRHGLERRVDT